jgi:hypothetical protein
MKSIRHMNQAADSFFTTLITSNIGTDLSTGDEGKETTIILASCLSQLHG